MTEPSRLDLSVVLITNPYVRRALDALLAAALPAGSVLVVDRAGLGDRWPDAPLVILDHDAADDIIAETCVVDTFQSRPLGTRIRPDWGLPATVLVCAHEPAPEVWWSAVHIGADHVVDLDLGGAWLVDHLRRLSGAGDS